MSRESTREYYRRKAQEEREGKNDSAKSTTSSTREYYRKKAQEEREARQPDTNKVSGGATGSKPVANNSTTNNNAATKPGTPIKPSESTTTTQPKQFYKPPEFWTDKDKLYTPVQEMEPTVKEKQAQLEQAEKMLKELEAKVRRDPSDERAYRDYERAYGGYQALVKELEPIFSEYKTAVDAYNAYVDEQTGLYDDWRGTVRDRETIEAELAELDKKAKDIKNAELRQLTSSGYSPAEKYTPADRERRGAMEAELAAIEEARALLNEELDYSRYFSYADLADAEDFAARSKAEGSKQSGNFFTRLFDSDAAAAYDYINNVEGYNETMQELNKVYGEKYDLSTRAYDFMDEDQVSTFNYLYNTQGAKAAEDYLDWLQEGLNYELGQHIAAGKEGTLEKLAYGVKAGADQFESGVKQFFMSDRLPTSSTQFASQAIREDLAETGPEMFGSSLGQLGYDAITTTTNMAPSILLSVASGGLGAPAALAQGLGAVSMGVSASGSDYNRQLADGRSKTDARTHSLLVGAAEGGLQYVLGGITSMGGKLPAKILSKVDGIDNALARILATGAVKIGSEVAEEELQNYIEPLLNTLIYDEAFDAPNFEELAYTALLTALTTGFLESGSIASAGSSRNAQQGAEFKSMGDETVQAIIEEGLASDPASKSYQTAEALKKKLDRGETISDHELGTLYQQNVEAVEAENAAQERVSREDVSVPNRSENVAPSSNLEAAAMEMAQEEMRRVQRAENLLNNPGYGEHGTSAFREIVEESGRDPGEVRTEFQTAYEAGRTGLPRTHITVLNPVQATAFNAGQQDLIADQARDKDNQAKGVKVSGKAGFDSTGVPKDVTKAEIEVLDRLFKAVGVHGHMAGNQSYNAKLTGTTDVAIANDFQREVYDSKGNVVRTFTIVDHGVHEAGLHQAMKLAPVQMRAFINDFYNYLGKDNVPTMGTLAQQKQDVYGAQDVSLTLDKAMEEVTANQVFATLYGSDVEQLSNALDRVMNGKNEDAKKGARTFLDVLSDLWKKVKAIAAQLRNKGDVKTAKEVEHTADAIKELRDKYEAALKVAVENAAKAEKNTAQQDGGTQFSLKNVDGKQVVWIEDSGLTRKQLMNHTAVAEYIARHIGEVYTIIESGQKVYIGEDLPGEYTHSKYTDSLRKNSPQLLRAKNKATSDLGLLIETATNRRWERTKHEWSKDAKYGMYRYDNSFAFPVKDRNGNVTDVRAFDAELLIRNASDGKKYLYDIVNIKENTASAIGLQQRETRLATHKAATRGDASADTIAQQEGNVKSEAEEQFSLVEDAATLEFLNNQKHVKVYRAMQEIDGKLYPPMAALVKGETGKKQLVEDTKKGEWYQADERPDLIKLDKNGKPKFELNKGNGGMVPAAYNPYFHTSASPLNDQFSSAYDRPNIVVVEGYIPSSELTSGYKAQYAKDSVGETAWHAGPVASKLKGEKARRVFLSRWFKAERVVPVDEVARIVAKTLDGENVSVPWNVVTPSLRKALEAEGVAIDYKDVKMGNKVVTFESTQYSLKDSDGNTLTEQQQEFFKDSKVRDEKGRLLVVYHGTNQGDFTKFLWEKTQRADGGFYGRGHYFTASKGMAEIYGSRVMQGYLNITNPFVWQEEINNYNGRTLSNIQARNIAARINMARVFPKLFANNTMTYGVFNDKTGEMEEKSVKWSELEKEITKTIGTLKPLVFFDNSVQWAYPGELWDHNVGERYASMEEAEGHKFEAAVQAFIDTHTGIAYDMTYDDQTSWTQDNGSEITDALISMGYDGAMQDRAGTEIVAFKSNQFKNADNLNPTEDDDINFSLKEEDGVQTATNKAGDVVAETHEDGSTMFSLKTYEEDGRAYLRSWLDKKVKSKAITREEADDITRQMDEFYDICQKFTDKYAPFGAWSEAEVVKGKDGKPAFSVVKANGDYAMNLDFSLVCKKRRTLDAVFREMINRGVLDDVELGEEQIAKINNIIRDSGFETACALCFVDSKRYRQAMVADNFVNMYNELVEMLVPEGGDIQAHHFDFLKRGLKDGGRALHDVPDSELGKGIVKLKKVMQEEPSNRTVRYKTASHLLHNPKDRRLVMRSEFMNTDGFEAVTVANRKVLGLYNSSKGSGGPKASLSDVQYLGDILKKSNFTPARAYAVGGVRIQSFSDYVPRLVFDYLQMIADLAAKKLPAHAYTKEEMFALQFGMTGVKINLSLVPAVDPKGVAPGLDADGNYVWYDGQSFGSDVTVKGSGQTGFQRAVEIQNATGYSANCGTIAVGISDEHIWKMLDDDDIRMVIPYHKSSLNHIVAVLNNIDKYTDYTGVQNTRYKATGSKIDGKDFNFNEALRRLGDAKAAANEYLEWCEKNGYLPKFDTFAEHENYYKLLEDFSTYDNGEAAPQGAVTMTFPKEGDAFGSMAQLIEQGLEEDAELEGRRQSDVPGIVDKIEAVYREGGMEKGAQFSLKEQGDLMRENAKLKEVNQALQEQLQVTKFAKVDKKSLERFAKQLLKDYSSEADVDAVRSSLDSLYTYLANGEDGQTPAWEQAYRMAYDTAQSVLENASEVNDELYQQYKGLRNRLRNTAIRLDRSYEHDMGGYESLEEFRRANFGRIKLSKDGIPVDTLYQELAATYPELFDESEHNHPGDQLAHIADVLADLQPYEWNPYGRNMREAATWLANDIMERFFELPQAKPTFADKAERKLTEQAIKDAKKLEALRTAKNERIAKLIREGREKVKTVQAKERTKRQEAVKEVKEHYKAKEKKMSESRKASVLRAKIKRHAGDLKEKLLRPTDKKHVPQELQGAVAKLLESINLESGYDMAFGKDGKYHRVERGSELGAEATKRTQAFAELRTVYAQLANELTIDPDLMGDDGLLNDVIKLADKPLDAMTSSELQTVWETLRAIEASVITANRMHAEGRWAVVSEAAEALREDNTGKKDKTELRGILGKGQKLVGLDMQTPETFFHLLGDAGDAVFRMMRNSQDEHIRLMKEVAAFTKRELKDANVRKLERELHTVTLGGEDVKLTTAQIMELYVLMHREQALDHIFVGGILPDVVSTRGIKKVSKAEPVRGISLEEVSKAVKVLTPEQKAIAEKLQKYASTKLSEYGNAAAMKVYGYEKFGEKNYWPIRSNRQEIKKDVQTDTATVTLANRGFTKGTKPHANNSVRLGSIFDTFSTHASEMATYSAWLGTLEDVNRLRNYKFHEDDAVIGTVSGIIDRVHGTQGSDYLAKLLNDVTNGVKGTHGETAYMSGLVGNFKAASVGANLRVIIQQPTSILRAMDMIGAHYLAVPGNPLNGWKKALKYAPIAQWKDWGYFDINTGRQMKDVLFDSDSAVDKVKSISMWGAGAMDSVAWGQLWNAVEAEVKAKRKELKPDTEEFYKAVAERFTEVVDHTQVVDGILQRSQIMRSADGLTKMATAFMGEPTKQYNMMMQAAYDAKNGKGNLRKAAMKKLARTAAALAIAGVVNSMAQSVMDAVRDDDKEEEWWEKWLAAFKSNLGSTFNPVSYIPFAKDVLSILEGYDVSRMDMESVEKLVSAGQNMIKALNGTGKHTVGAAAINLIAEIARLVGIPVSNLKREITSFSMLAAVETDNYVLQYRMEKWLKNLNYSGNSGTFMDILYNAYVNDKEAYKLIYDDMVASGYDADKLASGMESRMKKAQGVTKVDEMEQRYLSPDQQTKWDNALKSVQGSSVWKSANEEQRDGLEDDLYDLITQNSDGKKLQEDISEAAAYGVSESEYLLWQLALDMNNVDGKGGYNTSEKADALVSMTELSDFEKAYLWGTMTTSTEVFDAYDAGVDMDAYFGFKAGVSELEAGVDYKKGDTASRQAAIRMLLDSLGIDSDDRNWLYHTEYKK